MVQTKKFVKEVLDEHFQSGDSSYILGDFNVDGNYDEFPTKKVLQFFDKNPFGGFNLIKNNEYYLLHLILNSIEGFRFFNCFQKTNKFPHTFGEFHLDQDKNMVPKVF